METKSEVFKPTHMLAATYYTLNKDIIKGEIVCEDNMFIHGKKGLRVKYSEENDNYVAEDGTTFSKAVHMHPIDIINICGKNIKVEIQKDWFSIEQCKQNPNKLYVFGDNTQRTGKGGQAQIRDCLNTHGVATKLLPSNGDFSFFSDYRMEEHCGYIMNDIALLKQILQSPHFDTVVFAIDGLGTGLSDLPNKAPRVFQFLSLTLEQNFSIGTDQDLKLYMK